MNHKQFVEWLEKIEACDEAIRWVKRHKYTARQAFRACNNADYLKFALGELLKGEKYRAMADAYYSTNDCGKRCSDAIRKAIKFSDLKFK